MYQTLRPDLHSELDRLVPTGTRTREHVRMVVHCLIDLDLVHSLECAYSECSLPDRLFTPWIGSSSQKTRQPACLTVDHIKSVASGGSHLADNMQLMHFLCNSRKGVIEHNQYLASLDGQALAKERSDQLKKRWKDPGYREKMTRSLLKSNSDPAVTKRRSNAMKKALLNKTPEEYAERGRKAWETRRRNAEIRQSDNRS